MKLGLDIHGVLDHNPELFLRIAAEYDEVHIITGGSFTNTKYNLEKQLYQISDEFYAGDGDPNPNSFKWWTHQFSVFDYLLEIGAKTNEELEIDSHYPFPDEVWNSVKAEYCRQHKIDLHVDDMQQYLEYFTTPYMLYKDPTRKHRGT